MYKDVVSNEKLFTGQVLRPKDHLKNLGYTSAYLGCRDPKTGNFEIIIDREESYWFSPETIEKNFDF